MSTTRAIRDYMIKCPFLEKGHVNIDYLGTDATEYSIDCLLYTSIRHLKKCAKKRKSRKHLLLI